MEPTVYNHTRAIYRKLCAADRRDALQCARKLGIPLSAHTSDAAGHPRQLGH
jgi:hypothetical protein